MFVTDVDDDLKKTVPSMCFLIQHPKKGSEQPERIVFDLGIKRDMSQYAEGMQGHLSKRQPIVNLPDTKASIEAGGLDTANDIDYVILSHTQYMLLSDPSRRNLLTLRLVGITLDFLQTILIRNSCLVQGLYIPSRMELLIIQLPCLRRIHCLWIEQQNFLLPPTLHPRIWLAHKPNKPHRNGSLSVQSNTLSTSLEMAASTSLMHQATCRATSISLHGYLLINGST